MLSGRDLYSGNVNGNYNPDPGVPLPVVVRMRPREKDRITFPIAVMTFQACLPSSGHDLQSLYRRCDQRGSKEASLGG